MSTIYTDAAGNKYLGDCIWGNNDINFPSTSWLKSLNNPTRSEYLSDMTSIFSALGYTNVSIAGTYPVGSNQRVWVARPPSYTVDFELTNGSTPSVHIEQLRTLLSGSVLLTTFTTLGTNASYIDVDFQYAACANAKSVGLIKWVPTANRSSFLRQPTFHYFGVLENINPNFGYYTSNTNNHIVINQTANISFGYGASPIQLQSRVAEHYIRGGIAFPLESGRASYAISCSDGQTPGSQWATDMWVFDNNATLGYPVIGRVPNMLLGIGTYTYLKPVKIQGSVFPDNGSPWYLPVGTFSDKVLLMRCYSSMS